MSQRQMKKLFVFSLPRSGSTLLQKYLYRNNDISTISEPWILLPIYYMFKKDKVFSEYEHHLFTRAFYDLEMQGVDTASLAKDLVKVFSDAYYNRISDPEAKVFIDKTPRYSLICHEIMRDFSSDFFVLLFRHPLSCVSSMIKTFGGGNWCLYRFDIDIWLGLLNFIDVCKNQTKYKNLTILKYEDFVSDPEKYYQEICDSIGVDSRNKMELNEKPLLGTLGDQVGEKKFGAFVGNKGSQYEWIDTFNTLYRRRWARKLLEAIGKTKFELIGYEFSGTQERIGSSKYSFSQELKDLPHIALTFLHRHTGLYVLYIKFRRAKLGNMCFGER